MTLSMYQASVPVFQKMLGNLRAILQKGDSCAQAKKIDPSILLNTRLYLDMFALTRQVQIATDVAKGACARLTGQEERDITILPGGKEMHFKGQPYLMHWALPNFYFHVMATYAILRHNGVDVGKMDYLGSF